MTRLWVLVPVVLLALTCGVQEPPREAPPQTPPNILVILTDDQDADSVSEMPILRSRLADRGTTFNRAFVTTPLCCPSRASILLGQYAHNHKVWDNKAPEGGFERFKELGHEDTTVATWLDQAGYHTGYIGKYLNEYGSYDKPTKHVPPGWDRWIGYQGGPHEQKKVDGAFKVNNGGTIDRVATDGTVDTDYFARKAEDYIRSRTADNPWFLMVATNAPHSPALASKRNDGSYVDRAMPKTPAFNEGAVADKADVWGKDRVLPEKCPSDYEDRSDPQCVREVVEKWRDRMESLRDVDDMVAKLTGAISDKGFAQNTYVVFTSDNGFSLYKNRVFSKGAPYETSQQVPLIVKGPGVSANHVDNRLVANIDLAPTFAQWAGVRTPRAVDGRSLVPILRDLDAPWRTRLLFENRQHNHFFDAVRTSADQVYIEYPSTDETEYYDLTEDPYQLHGDAEKPPPQLEAQLKDLTRCAGADCRAADGTAPR